MHDNCPCHCLLILVQYLVDTGFSGGTRILKLCSQFSKLLWDLFLLYTTTKERYVEDVTLMDPADLTVCFVRPALGFKGSQEKTTPYWGSKSLF